MSVTTTLARRRNPVALITGTLSLLIALTVVAGYAIHDTSLITLVPGSAPMRLPTAVGILCCGGAVLLLAGGYRRTAAVAAVLCGLIGVANLGEAITGVYIPDIDLPALTAAPAHTGTLIGCLLILAAAALVLMSGVVRVRSRLAIVGVVGSVLHSIGAVAAISYFAGVSSAFTEGPFSRLALHTAVALALLGAALIRFAWRDSLAAGTGTPAWLPWLVGAGTLATSFCLYAAIASDQRSDFARQVAFDSEGLRQFVQAGLENRVQPLIRLARQREAVPGMKKEDWDADAQTIMTRGGYQAIEWIDADGKVVWTSPPGAGDATADGNAAFESRRRAAFDAARTNRALAATRPIDLVTGGKGVIVLVPVFVLDELTGYVGGVFRYQLLFQNLLASNPSPGYAIAVRDGGERVFEQGTPNRSVGLTRTMDLPLGGARWKLEIGPTESLVVQADSPLGGALLVAGALLAILFTLLTRLAQMARVHPMPEMAAAPAAAWGLATPIADGAGLAVVSCGRDGTVLVSNDAAKRLFFGAPPPIALFEEGFRMIHVTLLRPSGPEGSLDPLRPLLDSCTLPAAIFDSDGNFVAANPACVRRWAGAMGRGTAGSWAALGRRGAMRWRYKACC